MQSLSPLHGSLKATMVASRGAEEMPKNKGGRRELDNRVIECLHLLRAANELPPFDTVNGYFAEGRPIYEGAELRHQNHLQICVRNPARIPGCFLHSPFVGL